MIFYFLNLAYEPRGGEVFAEALVGKGVVAEGAAFRRDEEGAEDGEQARFQGTVKLSKRLPQAFIARIESFLDRLAAHGAIAAGMPGGNRHLLQETPVIAEVKAILDCAAMGELPLLALVEEFEHLAVECVHGIDRGRLAFP